MMSSGPTLRLSRPEIVMAARAVLTRMEKLPLVAGAQPSVASSRAVRATASAQEANALSASSMGLVWFIGFGRPNGLELYHARVWSAVVMRAILASQDLFFVAGYDNASPAHGAWTNCPRRRLHHVQ